MPARLRLAVACAVVATGGLRPPLARAADPLHARIDKLIEERAKAEAVPVAGPADDAEFLRRAYLDLAGTIPPADVVKVFLADPGPDKRAKLIDRLLAAPTYAARMADLFHVMLMERLGDHPEWSKYLRESFAANKPWDVMAKEMLRADPKAEPAARGASFFVAKRLENYGQNPVDYSALTRDVGRLFLGKNLQCCECHDHLFIEEYKQRDFQGLHAFFKNTFLVKAGTLLVGERPTTEKAAFASVFDKVGMTTGPALPGGAAVVELPAFPKGEEYAEKPDRKTGNPGVPKFSTLKAVSEALPRAGNRAFTRNIVNRLWFALMGRGLVHPLDLHHGGNPASHPELLDLLADEFAAHKFDVKWLLRELALTKTYQRSSLLPAGAAEPPHPRYFAVALEKRLSADQLLAATAAATGTDPKVADALRPKFVKAFANQPREPEDEVTPSLKAALFVLHDDAVLGLLKPKPGNLPDRLAKLSDGKAAEELYLAVLSRKPTPDEVTAIGALFGKHPDARAEALGRAAWALLASMEFGVNH
jgi:hypothetical protein